METKIKEEPGVVQISSESSSSSESSESDDNASDLEMLDYHQEVANAGFGDMLHDTERNEKYEIALRAAIAKVHAQGKKAHVLDIGTGTGLLSMMAMRAGADSVHACERFLPMANCAEKIFKLNEMNKIRLIKKSSFEMKIGIDMPRKANILVAELLDTELIGEGAIAIYNHAHKELLTDDVICIPSKAICYVQLCGTSLSEVWNSLKIMVSRDYNNMIEPPEDVLRCRGTMSLHDMQLSKFSMEDFEGLLPPQPAFTFDFSSKTPMNLTNINTLYFDDVEGACLNTVTFWWDIHFDTPDNLVLSCAPIWARPADEVEKSIGKKLTLKDIPWRDHWMQAMFYLPRPLDVPCVTYSDENEDKIPMICHHDLYSFWFDDKESAPPRCDCDFHLAHSRNRIGQLNYKAHNSKYLNFIAASVSGPLADPPPFHVITLGDSCVVGLSHVWSKAVRQLYCYEQHTYSRKFIEKLIDTNELDNVKTLSGNLIETLSEEGWQNITHIFAEPYFHDNELSWDNMGKFALMYYKLLPLLSKDVKVAPHSMKIYAMPMQFEHLHKLRMPAGIVRGFDLTPFDEMIAEARQYLSLFEPHPLWEYEGIPLGLPVPIHTFILKDKEECISEFSNMILRDGELNGIALWVDVHLDNSNTYGSIVSSGPRIPVDIDNPVQWNMFDRQIVYFLPTPEYVSPSLGSRLNTSVYQDPATNKYDFKFNVISDRLASPAESPMQEEAEEGPANQEEAEDN